MNPKPRRILRDRLLNHHNQPPHTKPRRQSSRAQNAHNPDLPHPIHPQRPQHRHRQYQDPEVTSDTNRRIGNDHLALVHARAAVVGAVPIG